MARNVLGGELIECSSDPMTGFYRNGKCDTCGEDQGMHTVCVQVTDAFLEFTAARGNDLSTPLLEYGFPGLQSGDFWCLCMGRWIEAFEAGVAPKLRLVATHASALEFVDMEVMQAHACD
ncbi:MAG: hypothetical protein ACJAU9_000412 [Lentimonas sp.]|jgi:uncharacterized protein (DUF2237 family)